MPGKDSKYIEFTKWTNRGRGTMGEFKFKDTVENLKTNLLDNLGLWVPTAIAANGIINGIIAYIFFAIDSILPFVFVHNLYLG